jgi:hypothetical protein
LHFIQQGKVEESFGFFSSSWFWRPSTCRRILRILLLFLVLMNQSEVRRTLHVLSSPGFVEVADPGELKGGKSRPSLLMTFSRSKNPSDSSPLPGSDEPVRSRRTSFWRRICSSPATSLMRCGILLVRVCDPDHSDDFRQKGFLKKSLCHISDEIRHAPVSMTPSCQHIQGASFNYLPSQIRADG